MARNNRRRREEFTKRSLPSTSSSFFTRPVPYSTFSQTTRRLEKLNLETWTPAAVRRTLAQVQNRNVNRPQKFFFRNPFLVPKQAIQSFVPQNPIRTTSICAKRYIRTQIMHAFGHAGKSGQRSPVFTSTSKVRCK